MSNRERTPSLEGKLANLTVEESPIRSNRFSHGNSFQEQTTHRDRPTNDPEIELDKLEECVDMSDDEGVSSDTMMSNVLFSGFLRKRNGKRAGPPTAISGSSKRFFVINQGSLIWYKSETDENPAGFVHVGATEVVDQGGSLHIIIKSPEKDYQLMAPDHSSKASFLAALAQAATLPPYDQLPTDDESAVGAKKEARKTALKAVTMRVEKRLAGRAITSDMGKKLLADWVNPDTMVLLESLKNLVDADPTHATLCDHFGAIEKELQKILGTLVKEKTMAKVRQLLRYFQDSGTVIRITTDPQIKPYMAKLVESIHRIYYPGSS